MHNILIVNKEQYGYHIDTYKYCVYLSKKMNITYICWDEGKERIITNGVKCIYLTKEGNIINRFRILFRNIKKEIQKNNYELIFLVYFFGCSLLKLLIPKYKYNLDIRTIAVTHSKIRNIFYDNLLKIESLAFENISVISENTGKQVDIEKFFVLPLGGESIVKTDYLSKETNLIYVGTLSNRNIMNLVFGFNIYLRNHPLKNKSTLTIIGDGINNELAVIHKFIKENSLEKNIITTGYIKNDELNTFFEKATCGVSYIPITPYYQNQPPTKTYEYLLSGLPVLATNTKANAKIVNKSNGVLIQDDPDSVAEGIFEISEQISSYDPKKIKKDMEGSLWENIVNKTLYPYLIDIIEEKEN